MCCCQFSLNWALFPDSLDSRRKSNEENTEEFSTVELFKILILHLLKHGFGNQTYFILQRKKVFLAALELC